MIPAPFMASCRNNRPKLLDRYPATMAWSLRKLRNGATKCIRVRRFNQVAVGDENDEIDIGFTHDGWLDVQAMWDFCCLLGTPTAGGAIAKRYDQSGNGYDLIQTNAASQPLIIENSVVKSFGVRPSLYFADNRFLRFDTATNPAVVFPPSGSKHAGMFAVANADGTGANVFGHLWSSKSSPTNPRWRQYLRVANSTTRQPQAGSGITGLLGGTAPPGVVTHSTVTDGLSGLHQLSALHVMSTTLQSYLLIDGIIVSTAFANTNLGFSAAPLLYAAMGGSAGSSDGTQESFCGHIPELILYGDNQFPNNMAISLDQKTAWGTL